MATFRRDAQDEVASANDDLRGAIAAMRRQLDEAEQAVKDGHRVRASVSGLPHVAGDATTLVRAIEARQAAYDRLVLVQAIATRTAAPAAKEA